MTPGRPVMWLPVPGYAGLYEVSGDGAVRSLDRDEIITGSRAGVRRRRGRTLRQFTLKTSPYLCVRLSKDGIARTRTVHTLVLEAFSGPCPEGMESRHLNGRHRDNAAANLAWGTPSENTQDQVLHGTHRGLRQNRRRRQLACA